MWKDLDDGIGMRVSPGFGLIHLMVDLQYGLNGAHSKSNNKVRGGADALLQALDRVSFVEHSEESGYYAPFLSTLLKIVCGPLIPLSKHVNNLGIAPSGAPPTAPRDVVTIVKSYLTGKR
ncbi:hypothetical protein FRC02_004141, partial [Tulasnella sp. 418]